MPPSLYLPDTLKKLACHLTWVEDKEIISEIPKSTFGSATTFKEFVQSLLDNPAKEILGENGMGEPGPESSEANGGITNDGGHVKFSEISCQLNLTALWAYVENLEEARTHLSLVHDLVKAFENMKDTQKFAMEYCTHALEVSINELEVHLKSSTSEDASSSFEDEMNALSEIWEEVQSNPECQAVIEFFRARLGLALTIPLDRAQEMIENVAELDPDYFEWHRANYRLIRRVRRNTKRNKFGALADPCEKEQLACRKAYSLAPDKPESLVDVGLLIKESLWTKDASVWEQQEDDYLLCVKLFREAISIAEQRNRKPLVCKIKLHLGEVHLSGRGSLLNQDEGKRLYEECERDFPNSSFVLHKMAKLYHNGGNGTRRFKDVELAKTYYKRALQASAYNYAALMDYFKLIRGLSTRTSQSPAQRGRLFTSILEEFDNSLEVIKIDHQAAKLHILKGCILWLFNPYEENDHRRKACEVWIGTLKNFPDFAEELYVRKEHYISLKFSLTGEIILAHKVRTELNSSAEGRRKTIQKPPFYWGPNKPSYILQHLVVKILVNIQQEEEAVRPEENLGSVISTFIAALTTD